MYGSCVEDYIENSQKYIDGRYEVIKSVVGERFHDFNINYIPHIFKMGILWIYCALFAVFSKL